MLQQTTVATVKTFYGDFMARWPSVQDLSAAALEDVLSAWAGLGYYARARNLHKCAQAVTRDHNGRFPETEEALRTLPGIGDYTAAAVAAIAFGKLAAPVDGNIARVFARLFRITGHGPGLRAEVKNRLEPLVPKDRPGDLAQALMDLGATICTPKKPACGLCPWRRSCQAHLAGDEMDFPNKPPKRPKPTRHGTIFWLEDLQGRVWMRKRPEKGLLGGMTEFPSTDWTTSKPDQSAIAGARPPGSAWRPVPGLVAHTFTHFHLELQVMKGKAKGAPGEGFWVEPDRFGDHALPTLMTKVVRLVQDYSA